MLNKNLFTLLGSYKKKLLEITFLNIISLLANVLITASFCNALYVAYLGNYHLTSYFIQLTMIILCVVIKSYIVIRIGKTKEILGANVKYEFRKKVTDKIYDLGITNDNDSISTMTQLVIEGIEQLHLYFTMFLPQFFYGMTAPIILFVICLFIEWKTALVLILCLPLIPLSIMFVSRFAKKIFKKYWDKYISMGDGFLDSVNGMKELKIFDADKRKQLEIAEKSEAFRKITMKVLVMQLSSLTIIDMVAFGGAGIAIVVTLQNTATSPEAIFKALFLILICAEFFLPMRGLGSAFHIAMNGSTAGNTLIEFLKRENKTSGLMELNKIQNIELQDVSFSYTDAKLILRGVNMNFTKGLHSIVGESGSGKSTITSLLIRKHSIPNGNILVNNLPLEVYNLKSYYQRLSIVGMNTHIFHMSIRDNFRLAKSDVTDEEIYIALEKVNMLDFIQKVGDLDYVILEDSQNISGGQKQRLAFAINTITEKDFYIFDEPTSNIDIESERIIMRNITKLAENNIVILISHRLQNVVGSKQIFMLNNKKVQEYGTHEELLANKGDYYKLYTKQYNLENSYKEVRHA